MRSLAICAASVLAACTCCSIASATPASDAIHQLDWLVGGTWTADASKLPGGVARIDVRYDWAATGNFVVFNTAFVSTDGSVKRRYAGNFFYDPAAKRLAMWYMDQDNSITQGPVEVVGDIMTMTFVDSSEAQPATYRVDVTRKTPDQYHWALFAQAGGAWKPVFGLDYARARP